MPPHDDISEKQTWVELISPVLFCSLSKVAVSLLLARHRTCLLFLSMSAMFASGGATRDVALPPLGADAR